MIDAEMLRMIRNEVARQVNIILSGTAANNSGTEEDIVNVYPGCPPLTQRSVMHPYGFVSSTPDGTTQVTAKSGAHPGNRLILGHRDANRPQVNKGECLLYNQYGQAVYLADGEIHIGTMASNDPVPVGNELLAYLLDFIAAYKVHEHTGNLGYGTPLSPADVNTATMLQANNLDNKNILSNYIFVDKGG